MVELKSCPFCGGKARLDYASGGNITYIDSEGKVKYTPIFYTVLCEECVARIGVYEKYEMAIDAWNKRV